MRELKWAIIGGGNGGQAMAGHLAIKGVSVALFDIFEECVSTINKKKRIRLSGAVEGEGEIDFASTCIEEVIKGRQVIVIVLPALYHREIAQKCAPFLEDGQIVMLHPSASMGAVEFKKTLDSERCQAKIILGESQTLLYACRATSPGEVQIFGVKEANYVAALPSKKNRLLLEALNSSFPQFKEAESVLATSLENINSMLHPAPSLLNVARIEGQGEWEYYYDGFTPSIGRYIDQMDRERINVGAAYGLTLKPLTEWFKIMYNTEGDSVEQIVKRNPSYRGISGQKSLQTRYILEDIPMSLVPIAALGRCAGVSVERMETAIQLGYFLLEGCIDKEGRTLANLGLDGMSKEEIIEYVTTGESSLKRDKR